MKLSPVVSSDKLRDFSNEYLKNNQTLGRIKTYVRNYGVECFPLLGYLRMRTR